MKPEQIQEFLELLRLWNKYEPQHCYEIQEDWSIDSKGEKCVEFYPIFVSLRGSFDFGLFECPSGCLSICYQELEAAIEGKMSDENSNWFGYGVACNHESGNSAWVQLSNKQFNQDGQSSKTVALLKCYLQAIGAIE